MKKRMLLSSSTVAACAMLVIILDTKTSIQSASIGLELCIYTIIPSLFPFIFLSGITNSGLLGRRIAITKFFRKFCKIPEGTESILLLGFLAGYPVGAQMIAQAYRQGHLSKNSAERMLGFCNNAGPAFIFGIVSGLFSNAIIPWLLWAIHIASALIVGHILPGNSLEVCRMNTQKPITYQQALHNALKTMSVICGWVILFRIIIGFCENWFIWILPTELQVIFSGILELSNGCIKLLNISDESMRFILVSPMLAFGGICIATQTNSVTQELSCRKYFPGKVLQTIISFMITLCLQPFLFKNNPLFHHIVYRITCTAFLCFLLILLIQKKLWKFRKQCCIIPIQACRKGQLYAVSKKNNPFLQLLPARNRNG